MNTGACPVPDWRTNYSDIILARKNNHIYIASCAMQFYKNKSYPKSRSHVTAGIRAISFLKDLVRLRQLLSPASEIRGSRTVSVHRLQHGSGHVLPQYYLFRHYAETGQTHKALNSAHTIIHSKFKQEGSTALQVKHLVKEYLSKTKEGGERQ
ncbi:MAG: hypothetical protein V8Q76_01805 [Bacteroides intestinalis]